MDGKDKDSLKTVTSGHLLDKIAESPKAKIHLKKFILNNSMIKLLKNVKSEDTEIEPVGDKRLIKNIDTSQFNKTSLYLSNVERMYKMMFQKFI